MVRIWLLRKYKSFGTVIRTWSATLQHRKWRIPNQKRDVVGFNFQSPQTIRQRVSVTNLLINPSRLSTVSLSVFLVIYSPSVLSQYSHARVQSMGHGPPSGGDFKDYARPISNRGRHLIWGLMNESKGPADLVGVVIKAASCPQPVSFTHWVSTSLQSSATCSSTTTSCIRVFL